MLKRNSTSYQSTLTSRIKSLFQEYQEKQGEKLMFHQYMIRDMMTNPVYGIGDPDNSRGLLIYHTVGTGKTVVAASVMVALMDIKQPVLLLPKSLQPNFSTALNLLIQDPKQLEYVKNKITFVALDAYNSAAQMKTKAVSLSNKLLIIDEAHNFFKSIINSANDETNARTLYHMIMNAVNCRILFLTGTPLTKDPFELVPCINMLCGREVLPPSYESFYSTYVDNHVKVCNRPKLQNRLFGLISHIAFDMPLDPHGKPKTNEEIGRPKDLGIEVQNVEMGYDQYLRYITVRDREDKLTSTRKAKRDASKTSQRIRDVPSLTVPSSISKGSSYFIESRQQSDFSPPPEYRDVTVDKLPDDVFDKNESPKINHMMGLLKKGNKPALIYSQFIKAGLAVVARYLMKDGYTQWLPGREGQETITHAKRYCIISGGVAPPDRVKILQMFNSSANMYGDIISCILISETGAEGLDFKHIREVHILEPYWDFARILQVQGRGIRKGGHSDLPESERNVKTYIYVSKANKKAQAHSAFKENETIDERFLRNAMRKYRLIEEFLGAMKEVCIECVSNMYDKYNVSCRVCLPDNVQLFHPKDVLGDIVLDDPCRPFSDAGIKTKSITIDDRTFHYRKDAESPLGYYIYQYNKELDGYIELPLNSPETTQIVEQIEQKIVKII